MTEISGVDQPGRAVWTGRIALLAIAANLFAVVTVTFWIYYARILFSALRPDYVSVQSPTISRAISEPSVGVPFSVWITLSAVLLVFGVFWLVTFYRRLLPQIDAPSRYLAQAISVGAPLIMVLQAMAGVGMYMLSSYRFPDFNEMHMVGSYLFFLSQALVVIIATVQCDALLRDRASLTALKKAGLMSPGMVLLRKRLGQFSIGLTLLYIILFKLKDIDLNVMNDYIYIAYTTTEPLLITAFLLVLALFQTDLLALRRMAQRSS